MHTKETKEFTKAIPRLLFILCAAFIWTLAGNPEAMLHAAGKTAITLNVSKKTLVAGDSFKLKASIKDNAFKNHAISWKSSNGSVASVSQKGNVNAKKAGTAKITATVKGTAHKASCTVKVRQSQGAPADATKAHYANAGIEFDYPSDLKAKKSNGEDGGRTEFTDKDGSLVFWYEQGEKWRVDLGQDKAAYQKQLAERYPNAKIGTYAKETVNGQEMLKVSYWPDGETGGKVAEYLLTSEYAFFDFHFPGAGEDFAKELVGSVRFSKP